MTFNVIDNQTGLPPDLEQIALHESWAKGLTYCDIEGFALTEDGSLILTDEDGNYCYCPVWRFKVIIKEVQ